MMHSAPMIRSAPTGLHSVPTSRSFSGFRSVPRSVTSGGITTRHIGRSAGVTSGQSLRSQRIGSGQSVAAQTQLNRQVTNSNQVNRNQVTRTVQGVGRAKALRNNAFASSSTRNAANRAMARSTFHGRFAGQNWHPHGGWNWRHRIPIIVIGWGGALFWPYAYWDFVDYTFWPYAYDVFWPYAYDDLYVGMFGPYAYEGAAYSGATPSRRRARATASSTTTVVCSERAPALTDWPIQQITQTINPNEAQQAALNELKDGTAKAVDLLQSACPDELPSTPTGRLAAMRQRIETMLQALGLVQPPLQRLYGSLSDEQKARFNAIAPDAQPTRSKRGGNQPPDLSQVCSGQVANATSVPTDRIEWAVRPTEAQRSALAALNAATVKAADSLKANCPQEQTLTPPGRLAAMEQRLNAMLDAIKIVQPALEEFYGSLTDEQKARFNQLSHAEG
jgi:LTXXQ motif family protein